MKLYLLQQLPIKGRYQEWLGEVLVDGFKSKGYDVEPIRMVKGSFTKDPNLFTNYYAAIKYELEQLLELHERLAKSDEKAIIFVADIDFPGITLPYLHLIKKKRDVKLVGYIHAGSYCTGDIFANDNAKRLMEKAMFDTYDLVLVATHYHKRKMIEKLILDYDAESKIKVVGFPLYIPGEAYVMRSRKEWHDRAYDVVIPSPGNILVTSELLSKLLRLRSDLKVAITFPIGDILPPEIRSKVIELRTMGRPLDIFVNSKIALSTKDEETFGVAMAEAYEMGCVVVAPRRCAYEELYPHHLLYKTLDEAVMIIMAALMMGHEIYGTGKESNVNDYMWKPSIFFDSVDVEMRKLLE